MKKKVRISDRFTVAVIRETEISKEAMQMLYNFGVAYKSESEEIYSADKVMGIDNFDSFGEEIRHEFERIAAALEDVGASYFKVLG